jgi:hypothetical protein
MTGVVPGKQYRNSTLASAPVFSDRLGRCPLHTSLHLDEINQIANIGEALAFRT